MLRVHPTLRTQEAAYYDALFTALGLRRTPDVGRMMYDADGGRVSIAAAATTRHETDEPLVELGFEVSDLAEFARRTRQDGTPARVRASEQVEISTPHDGSIPARLGPRDTGAAPTGLHVRVDWHTPRPEEACTVLRNIGARPRPANPAGAAGLVGPAQEFSAKNGGVIAVLSGHRSLLRFGFEYDGDPGALAARLSAADIPHALLLDDGARSLRIDCPAGAVLWVRQSPV